MCEEETLLGVICLLASLLPSSIPSLLPPSPPSFSPPPKHTHTPPNRERHHDFDFLSSLEVVIVDQTDVFLMQNWSHLTVREGEGDRIGSLHIA